MLRVPGLIRIFYKGTHVTGICSSQCEANFFLLIYRYPKRDRQSAMQCVAEVDRQAWKTGRDKLDAFRVRWLVVTQEKSFDIDVGRGYA